MASGMGVRGTMGRCYGFFADYKQCQTDARAALRQLQEENPPKGDMKKELGGCFAMREDYFECLHGRKQNARIKTVMDEMKKQEREKKSGVSPENHH